MGGFNFSEETLPLSRRRDGSHSLRGRNDRSGERHYHHYRHIHHREGGEAKAHSYSLSHHRPYLSTTHRLSHR